MFFLIYVVEIVGIISLFSFTYTINRGFFVAFFGILFKKKRGTHEFISLPPPQSDTIKCCY